MKHFMTAIDDTRMTLVFSSSYRHVDKAVTALMAFLQHKHVPYDSFAMNLILREGMNNAVQHGNGNDPCRHVRAELVIEPQDILITIEDEGQGFHWQQQRIPDVEAGVPHGRGLWLMRTYGFEVSHNAKGNVLRLRKGISQTEEGERT